MLFDPDTVKDLATYEVSEAGAGRDFACCREWAGRLSTTASTRALARDRCCASNGEPTPASVVGGASGSGKSTTARLLARELDAGWLQIDTIWVAFQEALRDDPEAQRILRVDERIFRSDDSVEELFEHPDRRRPIPLSAALPGALDRGTEAR